MGKAVAVNELMVNWMDYQDGCMHKEVASLTVKLKHGISIFKKMAQLVGLNELMIMQSAGLLCTFFKNLLDERVSLFKPKLILWTKKVYLNEPLRKYQQLILFAILDVEVSIHRLVK